MKKITAKIAAKIGDVYLSVTELATPMYWIPKKKSIIAETPTNPRINNSVFLFPKRGIFFDLSTEKVKIKDPNERKKTSWNVW